MTSFTLTGKKEEGPLGEELLQSDDSLPIKRRKLAQS